MCRVNEIRAIYEADEIVKAAEAVLWERVRHGNALSSPRLVVDFLKVRLQPEEREVFGVLYLDNQHKVIEFEALFKGTIDAASVYPREVVKAALKVNAAAVILSHNHPSGMAEPSAQDREITKRLIEALGLVGIGVLDHIIVGNPGYVSFAERGLI